MARHGRRSVGQQKDPVKAKYGEAGVTYLENLRENTGNSLVRRAVDEVTSAASNPPADSDSADEA